MIGSQIVLLLFQKKLKSCESKEVFTLLKLAFNFLLNAAYYSTCRFMPDDIPIVVRATRTSLLSPHDDFSHVPLIWIQPVIVLVAKFPIAGSSKTRLAPVLGFEGAATFARLCLIDILHRFIMECEKYSLTKLI